MKSVKPAFPGLPLFVLEDGAQPRCTLDDAWMFSPGDSFKGGRINRGQLLHARSLCRPCPLREQCLAYAVGHRESGIWGGEKLSEGKLDRREWAQ